MRIAIALADVPFLLRTLATYCPAEVLCEPLVQRDRCRRNAGSAVDLLGPGMIRNALLVYSHNRRTSLFRKGRKFSNRVSPALPAIR